MLLYLSRPVLTFGLLCALISTGSVCAMKRGPSPSSEHSLGSSQGLSSGGSTGDESGGLGEPKTKKQKTGASTDNKPAVPPTPDPYDWSYLGPPPLQRTGTLFISKKGNKPDFEAYGEDPLSKKYRGLYMGGCVIPKDPVTLAVLALDSLPLSECGQFTVKVALKVDPISNESLPPDETDEEVKQQWQKFKTFKEECDSLPTQYEWKALFRQTSNNQEYRFIE